MRRGVVLLDVLVAALILAIGLAVTMSLASQSLIGQGVSERRITASWLADGLLSMVLAEGPERYSLRQPAEGRFDAPFTDYDFHVNIRAQGDWAPFEVTATVSWMERGGPMNVQVQTLVAPRQGDEDDWNNWRPQEPLDREARSWDEDEEEAAPGAGGG
ncbi:MAG: hypothetical protein MK101_09185 [Phycisphaerales bacterium]|nr:hypothetical protein [Phycisphaerales bacterium]